MAEIDRIATTTSFNGLKLLDGNFSNKQFQVGAQANETVGVTIASAKSDALGVVPMLVAVGATFDRGHRCGGNGRCSVTVSRKSCRFSVTPTGGTCSRRPTVTAVAGETSAGD